jgi:hypothetical protein
MPDNPERGPGLNRPFRVIRWLGYEVMQRPLIRMLHETRAIQTSRDKLMPVESRPSYKFRQQRVYARGRDPINPDIPPMAPKPVENPDAAAAAPAETLKNDAPTEARPE